MQTEHRPTPQAARRPWYQSVKWMLGLLFISFVTWIAIALMTADEFTFHPTMLILKNESCDFLRQNGIDVPSTGTGTDGQHNCTLTAPFLKPALLGKEGVIYLKGRRFRIDESQIVVVGSIDNSPWTTSHTRSVILLWLASLLFVGVLVWTFLLMCSSYKEQLNK